MRGRAAYAQREPREPAVAECCPYLTTVGVVYEHSKHSEFGAFHADLAGRKGARTCDQSAGLDGSRIAALS